MENNKAGAFILGVCLMIGMAGGALAVAGAMNGISASQRFVTVKGLAEREVDANFATWKVDFSLAEEDLSTLQSSLFRQKNVVIDYFTTVGFTPEEIFVQPSNVEDKQASRYGNERGKRYTANVTISVKTGKVELMRKAVDQADELVRRGIMLSSQCCNRGGASYLFTGLNDIKPVMIAEATTNARKVAEQFAQDSGSAVGQIKRARQGLFSIKESEGGIPWIKKVRVVTTVDYFLAD